MEPVAVGDQIADRCIRPVKKKRMITQMWSMIVQSRFKVH